MKPPQKNLLITSDEWQQALEEAISKKIQPIPAGWITLEQFGKLINRLGSQARLDMITLIEDGSAESKMFQVLHGTKIHQARHYRLLKKK